MTLLTGFERLHGEMKSNKWIRWFAVFCRIVLALGFIPSGIVKVTGERFTGLPSNHPLGHYFDALLLTGYYYTFIGTGQLTTALLLLIPRTALLGALCYFPIILNICVLDYATRFNGIRIVTLMILANLFLLALDYDRLKQILLPSPRVEGRQAPAAGRFPALFFGCVLAAVITVVIAGGVLFDITPGNDAEECANQCKGQGSFCQTFCDCIYKQGSPLNACLKEYQTARKAAAGP